MTKPPSLFDRSEMAPLRPSLTPAARVEDPATPVARPAGWRAPTEGELACGTCYADGPNTWCPHHVPLSFFPAGRGR
jgi:hypothetical protein